MRNRVQSGFTLIELLVAISVLAILLVIAVPSFLDFFERSRLRGATDDISALVSTARSEAVKSGRNVTIGFTGDANVWCVGANQAATPAVGASYVTSASCDCSTAGSCNVDGIERVVRSSDYNNVTMASFPSPASFDIDSKQGAVTDLSTNSATFISPNSSFRLQLTVSALGQTSSCVPSGNRAMPGFSPC